MEATGFEWSLAARFVSWGAHLVHNPVCRCAVCSSFTPLELHGCQVHQKETHQHLLLWEVSVVQQRRSGLREVIMDDVQQLKNSSLTLHPLDTCNAQIAIADMVAQ